MKSDAPQEKPIAVWVEDDPDFQAVVREWLLPHFDLMTYGNAESLLDELIDLEPEVFILDVRLPGMDGFKLCREIRRSGRLADVPVLFLTSSEEDADFVKHMDAGGTAFLNKPVRRRELLAALKELSPA